MLKSLNEFLHTSLYRSFGRPLIRLPSECTQKVLVLEYDHICLDMTTLIVDYVVLT
jgi:hypothetical protein